MSNTCILAVDYQTCEKNTIHTRQWQEICVNTNRLLYMAREVSALIVHCIYYPQYVTSVTAVLDPAEFDGRSIRMHNELGELCLCESAHWKDVKLELDIARFTTDRFLVKPDKSAFEHTELSSTLRSLGISRVITTGFQPYDCVEKTAISAVKDGFESYVATDCTTHYRPSLVSIKTATSKQIIAMLKHDMKSENDIDKTAKFLLPHRYFRMLLDFWRNLD